MKKIVVKKSIKPSGKPVKGSKYVAADEQYDKKMEKKELKGMSTAGIATELKESESEQGYSKKPKVKPQKKNAKIAKGQKNIS